MIRIIKIANSKQSTKLMDTELSTQVANNDPSTQVADNDPSVKLAHNEHVIKSMDIGQIAKTIAESIAKKINGTVLTAELVNKLIDETYTLLDTKETVNFTNIHDLMVNISRHIVAILESTYEFQTPNSIDYDKLAKGILSVRYKITQYNSIKLNEFEEKYKDKSLDDKYLLAVNESIDLFHDLNKKYNFNYNIVKLLTEAVKKKNTDLINELLPEFINNMSYSSEYNLIVNNLYTITIINDDTNLVHLIHTHISGKSNKCLYCTLSNHIRTILLVHQKKFLHLMKFLRSDKSCCVNTNEKNNKIISETAYKFLLTGNPDGYHIISMYFDINIDLNIKAVEIIDSGYIKSIIYLLNHATIIDYKLLCRDFSSHLSYIITNMNNYENLLELREYLRTNNNLLQRYSENINMIDQILKFE